MAQKDEFVDYLLELMQPLGGVSAKRMFGGHGIFKEGLMFGLVANDELYLKVDKENKAEFEELGLEPFVYMKNDKPMNMSYHLAPSSALDDSEFMVEWARSAYQAAGRTKKPKKKK